MDEPGRKSLPHERPLWLSDAQTYFVTICTLSRGENVLAKPEVAWPLIDSFAWRHEQCRWYGLLFLIMPDHVHFLAVEYEGRSFAKELRDWKKYVARTLPIPWQRDFFEHRLRHDESRSEKYDYISLNPVRAGLVGDPTDWLFVWTPEEKSRTAGASRPYQLGR